MVSMSMLGQLDCALPPRMAKALRDSAKELQMMPEAATKALKMINEPDCNIASFAAIVEEDVKLASDILRLANSPFYSTGHPIGNVREAVVQVGFRQCQNLIHASCASSLMQRLEGADARTKNDLWQHSLMTAQLATELSSDLKLSFAGEEFTAGLMHDLGRLLYAVLMPEEFPSFDQVDFQESVELLEIEQAATSTNHCAIGCSFSLNNSLPDTISEAIRFHHEPDRATISPQLVALIAAADDLANHLARQEPVEAYQADNNVGLEVLLGLTPEAASLNPDTIATSLFDRVTVKQT